MWRRYYMAYSTGVELLLTRMDSNPEEFEIKLRVSLTSMRVGGRWAQEVAYVLDEENTVISVEEREAVREKLDERERQEFANHMMNKIVNRDDLEGEDKKSPRFPAGMYDLFAKEYLRQFEKMAAQKGLTNSVMAPPPSSYDASPDMLAFGGEDEQGN
jgi:hypothetical protein